MTSVGNSRFLGNPYLNNTYTNRTKTSPFYHYSSNLAENANTVKEAVVESGEICTDGKDDGKIGFFSAAWNAIKGIGKTVVNGVKGMFTDKEGNFSIGKSLLSIATVAACIAFPAVGLVACGIGVVAGGIQVGKGIYKAATADTDAEAKEAWQNIGGGAFTAVTSALGAKACYGAMKSSSSIGALEGLSKDATLGAKAKALFSDAKSSTVNRFTSAKDTALAMRGTRIRNKAANIVKDVQGKIQAPGAEDGSAVQEVINLGRKFQNNNARITNLEGAYDRAANIYSAGQKAAAAVRHPLQTAGKGFQALRSINLKSVPANLQEVALTVYNQGKEAAIQEHGYEAVMNVLKIAGSYAMIDQTV